MNRIFQWVILLTIGLIVVVVGCGTMQWVSELSMWTRTDSGWIQAIGSIAALGVAIFVMHRQNKNALRLILDAENRSFLRRANSVHAIVKRAHKQLENCLSHIEKQTNTGDIPKIIKSWKMSKDVTRALREVLLPIPAHELGTYDLARGVHQTIDAIALLEFSADSFANDPNISLRIPDIPLILSKLRGNITTASTTFQVGLDELTKST